MFKRIIRPVSVLFLGLLFSTQSHAILINVTGQGASSGTWDIQSYRCPRNLECVDLLNSQKFFGDRELARAFAEATYTLLDFLNTTQNSLATYTPFFLYQPLARDVLGWAYQNDLRFTDWIGRGLASNFYAVATRATSVTEPSTLALLALSLIGLGITRRRSVLSGCATS